MANTEQIPNPWLTPRSISIMPGAEQSLRIPHEGVTAGIALLALACLPPPLHDASVRGHSPGCRAANSSRPSHQMPGLRLHSPTHWLCDYGPLTKPLCASAPPSPIHLNTRPGHTPCVSEPPMPLVLMATSTSQHLLGSSPLLCSAARQPLKYHLSEGPIEGPSLKALPKLSWLRGQSQMSS